MEQNLQNSRQCNQQLISAVLESDSYRQVEAQLLQLQASDYQGMEVEDIYNHLHYVNTDSDQPQIGSQTKSAAWFMLLVGLGLAALGSIGLWIVG